MSTIYLHRLPYEPLHFVTRRRRSYVFPLDYLTPAVARTNDRLRQRRERRRMREWLRCLCARWRAWRDR